MNRAAVLWAAFGFLVAPAYAQVVDVTTSLTLSTSSPVCLPANAARRSLAIDNSANASNIGYCETNAGAAACTPSIGSGGTTTLAAALLAYWAPGSAPQNRFCFIAAMATPTITIREGH